MGKVGRRPQAAKFPLRGTKPLYHRPLIRHGFAVPPSPQGEGFWGEHLSSPGEGFGDSYALRALLFLQVPGQSPQLKQ